jgi:hypothetical protein
MLPSSVSVRLASNSSRVRIANRRCYASEYRKQSTVNLWFLKIRRYAIMGARSLRGEFVMIRTGQQYLDSIRDNREVYINGERVKDVTRHPMLKPLIDIRARIYDMQHVAATRSILSFQQDGEWQAVANKLPRTQQDWWDKRRATDTVLDTIGGIVTRVGDETIGEMWSLFDGQEVLNEVDPQFSANIRRHVQAARLPRTIRWPINSMKSMRSLFSTMCSYLGRMCSSIVTPRRQHSSAQPYTAIRRSRSCSAS